MAAFDRIKAIIETNGAVEVWYAGKHARSGEAGYHLERTKIVTPTLIIGIVLLIFAAKDLRRKQTTNVE